MNKENILFVLRKYKSTNEVFRDAPVSHHFAFNPYTTGITSYYTTELSELQISNMEQFPQSSTVNGIYDVSLTMKRFRKIFLKGEKSSKDNTLCNYIKNAEWSESYHQPRVQFLEIFYKNIILFHIASMDILPRDTIREIGELWYTIMLI